MSQVGPLGSAWADAWGARGYGQPALVYGDEREPTNRPDLVSADGMPTLTGARRSSMAERASTSAFASAEGASLQEGRAYAHGPRRSSSFGPVFSSRPFPMDASGTIAQAGQTAQAFHEEYPSHSQASTAAAAPELHSGRGSLLPSAMIDPTPPDLGARPDSLENGLWSLRSTWTAEQNAYRDVEEEPLALEEFATEILGPPLAVNAFSPNSFEPSQSISPYSASSSASRSTFAGHRMEPHGGSSPPGTSPMAENGTRRWSIISDSGPASPPKRTSPRKVATVTTTFDAKGSPTKSIRRISKLNLDASPSSRSPSVSPRKGPRRHPPRIAPAIPPDTRDSASARARPSRGDGAPSGRRVSFGSVEHVPVPSVLLPANPTRFTLSGMVLSPDDFALLDEVTLLPGDDLPVPPATAPSWLESFELPIPPDQFYRPSIDGGLDSAHVYRPSIYLDEHARPPSVSSFTLPANPHARAHSAYAEDPTNASASGLTSAAPGPPLASPSARRRSSTASYDYVPVSSQRYPVPASPWNSGLPVPYNHDDRVRHLPQPPRTFKLPAYGSGSTSSASPSPVSDSRPVTPPSISAPAPIVIASGDGNGGGGIGYPPRAISSPVRKVAASPKKKRSPVKGKRQPGAMFVNYSSQDAVRDRSPRFDYA